MGTRYDVNIAGYALAVQTERSAEHMVRLADTLNGRVREIQKAGGTSNYMNIVMLAAMELADDFLTSEERIQEALGRNRELEERASRIEADSLKLQEQVRRLVDETANLREEAESLRREREGLKEAVDRKSRDLLATLEDALK